MISGDNEKKSLLNLWCRGGDLYLRKPTPLPSPNCTATDEHNHLPTPPSTTLVSISTLLWLLLKDYGSSRMDTNDSLRVASLWHSMHAISQQLSPVSGCAGIELLQPDTFDLHCFQSLTGTKFFVVCEPGTQQMESLLKFIYELYTDYVLKNPFYEMEMPIRCELFDINLAQAVQKDRVALLGR
ncbi:unnamed protein product [Vicia faba]|uniref:Trafficking protein particle complex subunit n=1 Tax=Vicia faba TaxID=3906 RepID=A0AAV1BFL6_VICFA|nr:unnamed protein product [Vicia faba]